MATIAASPARIYVGADHVQGAAVGLDAKKNVHLHRDKNLRLAIFVPERARAGGQGTAGHVATSVSRAAYHQLRACSANSNSARKDESLRTAQTIFDSVPGLAEKALQLQPQLQIELAKRLADGRFEFAYQGLPPDRQQQALALEVAGGADDVALWHQALVHADLQAQGSAAIDEAAEVLRRASSSADLALAPGQLMDALVQADMQTLKDRLGSMSAIPLRNDEFDSFAESLCAKSLASFALTQAGRLMPSGYFEKLAEALRSGSVLKDEPPTPALRTFLVGQLSALATQADLRQTISSISAPPAENLAIEDQLRADLVIAPPAALTAADARQAVIGALLTPLRQGDVGSCFVTSVAIRQQIHQPVAMVAQLRTMIEHGYVEGRSGHRTERLPINPGLGQSSPQLSSDPGRRAVQEGIMISALALALARAGQGASSQERSAMASDILSRHLAAPAPRGRALDALLRGVLAEAMGLKFDLPAASDAASERMKPLLQSLRASKSPADQLDILRTAIRDLNADIHRLSQAEAVDESAIGRAIDDLQDMQNLLPSDFDLGQFEQATSLADSRLHAFNENRLLRTWEFSMASAGLSRKRHQDLHSVLVGKLLAPRIAEANDSIQGSLSTAKRQELAGQLQRRISDRIQSDLVYQHMTEIPQELALDGQSSRGGWVLFDRGGASDPSQWRRIDSEHDLRMTLRGLVRQVSREVAQGRSSQASREQIKALGQRLEAGLQGADFEKTVNRTTDRADTYKAALLGPLVDILVGDTNAQSSGPPVGGMFGLDRSLAMLELRSLKDELQQCLSQRLVFTPTPVLGGRVQWRAHDSQVPPPELPEIAKTSPLLAAAWMESSGEQNRLLTEADLKKAIDRILGDRISGADPARPGFNVDLRRIRSKLAAMDLSACLEHLSPTTSTSDAKVHRPVWSVDGGGHESEVMAWLGAAGQEVSLMTEAASPRGPEEFFAQLVAAVRRIQPKAAAAGRPLLVSGHAHAFSLNPQGWQEAIGPAAGDPKAWLQRRLGPGQHLELADMNWGTGSRPRYLALGHFNGKVEFGWADGDRFGVDPEAQTYAQVAWAAWKDASSGFGWAS